MKKISEKQVRAARKSTGDHLLAILRSRGLLSQNDICQQLAISQATFSRAFAQLRPEEVVRIGNARRTKYAATRNIQDVGNKVAVIVVSENGKAQNAGELISIFPKGFVWLPKGVSTEAQIFPDLPYFLDDLRPQGFLGRTIPRAHPSLGYPSDIRIWSGDQCLGYLTQYGSDSTGQILLGERALTLFQDAKTHALTTAIGPSERQKKYPEYAKNTLQEGPPGSSAAGEQPKFTCHLKQKIESSKSVLVKFSPPIHESVGRRIADLLVAESIAHSLLQKSGISAAKSSILEYGHQFFLEIERYDRTSSGGRRGVISLNALNLEFAANLGTWTDVAQELVSQKILTAAHLELITKLDLFGELIANSDRHNGNLSLFFDNFQLGGVTPVYDMLPMLYMPQQGQILHRDFAPSAPKVSQLPQWHWAKDLALKYWALVSKENKISKDFRAIANTNLKKLMKLDF